jgi:hypothetical protein
LWAIFGHFWAIFGLFGRISDSIGRFNVQNDWSHWKYVCVQVVPNYCPNHFWSNSAHNVLLKNIAQKCGLQTSIFFLFYSPVCKHSPNLVALSGILSFSWRILSDGDKKKNLCKYWLNLCMVAIAEYFCTHIFFFECTCRYVCRFF